MLQKQVKSINRHGPFHLKTFVFFWIATEYAMPV